MSNEQDEAEIRRQAAAAMGRARTPKKLAAIKKNSPFQWKPLSEIPCTCGAGDSLTHKGTCPRYHAIRRRKAKGLPLE